MGSRQLRRWLNRPLTDQPTLRSRYQALGALINGRSFEGIREHLTGIGDIERILARVALRSARPRDLTQLRAPWRCCLHCEPPSSPSTHRFCRSYATA